MSCSLSQRQVDRNCLTVVGSIEPSTRRTALSSERRPTDSESLPFICIDYIGNAAWNPERPPVSQAALLRVLLKQRRRNDHVHPTGDPFPGPDRRPSSG